MPAAEPVVLNRELVLETVQGSFELLTELTLLFRESAAANLREIQSGLASGDVDRVRLNAHALKGASSALAGERVAALARELEQLAAANDLDRAPSLAAVLAREVDALNLALTTLSIDSRA